MTQEQAERLIQALTIIVTQLQGINQTLQNIQGKIR